MLLMIQRRNDKAWSDIGAAISLERSECSPTGRTWKEKVAERQRVMNFGLQIDEATPIRTLLSGFHSKG
jgi:hypothetical protein